MRGFKIHTALMDGGFAHLQDACHLLQIQLNTTSRDEHVGEIERYIRTIKERMRAVFNTLPFQRLPKIMIIELAKNVVYWLNTMPPTNGVSKTQSP